MEEKQMMTNEQLEGQLNFLRVKAALTAIPFYGAIAAMALSFITSTSNGQFLIRMGICLVILVVFGALHSSSKSTIKKLLVDHIIGGVLKEVLGDSVEYGPTGRVEPGDMVFPFAYESVSGSDHIKAVYQGPNIELSDIEIGSPSKKRRFTPDFKGQWLICDFGKELSGELRLYANDKEVRKQCKENIIETESETFNERFLVIAKDAQEAYRVLTPHVMEYILTMADLSGGKVYLSFLRGGKMQVAVNTGRNFLELGTSEVDMEGLRQKFLGELRWFTDIIDTLRVEDTLYQKADA